LKKEQSHNLLVGVPSLVGTEVTEEEVLEQRREVERTWGGDQIQRRTQQKTQEKISGGKKIWTGSSEIRSTTPKTKAKGEKKKNETNPKLAKKNEGERAQGNGRALIRKGEPKIHACPVKMDPHYAGRSPLYLTGS